LKYALINNDKVEAIKGAKGSCPICNSELVAKCGEVKVNHWAHKGNRNCDPWWENETDWHRAWKNKFPIDWQEVVHSAENGEKHIADVKTVNNWVLEFQHSYLKPDERRSRNAFYKKLVWVVDGMRRERDKEQFQNVLKDCRVVKQKPLICRIFFPEECRIISEWLACDAFVFFDFNVLDKLDDALWFMLPNNSKSGANLMRFPRKDFIQYHIDGIFNEIIKKTNQLMITIQTLSKINEQIMIKKQIMNQRIPIYRNHFRKRL
jgi:hypothetical protein